MDYGSNGRGKWNDKLNNLLIDGPLEWNEKCKLKFAIQTYETKDFDEMTLYPSFLKSLIISCLVTFCTQRNSVCRLNDDCGEKSIQKSYKFANETIVYLTVMCTNITNYKSK